ncbi:MAG: AgmX/PglI C-terminal domain-containing protein [bacterium]
MPSEHPPVTLTFQIHRDGALLGEESLSGPVIKVGRLASAQLRLDDDSVSRVHALIQVHDEDNITVSDLGSATGTRVNGRRYNRCALKEGDVLQLGRMKLVLSQVAPSVAHRAVAAPAPPARPSATPAPGVPLWSDAAPPVKPEPATGSALEVVALYGDTPQAVHHFRTARGGKVSVWSALCLASGLLLAVGGAVAFGSQIYAVKRQEAQRAKVLAFVKERGLPEKFVPEVRTHRPTELAGALCFASGLFLIIFGGLRVRDERRVVSFTIGEDPKSTYSTPVDALPSSRFPLVSSDGESYLLSFTPHMSGTVTLPGADPVELPGLVSSGAATASSVAGAYTLPLRPGARCKLDMGMSSFLINSVPAGAVPDREAAGAVIASRARQPIAMSTAGAGAVMLAFLLLFQLKPAEADAIEADGVSRYENKRIRDILKQARKDRQDQKKAEPEKIDKKQQAKLKPNAKKAVAGRDDDRIRSRNSGGRSATGVGHHQGPPSERASGMVGVLKSMSKRLANMMSRDSALSQQMEDSLAALDGYHYGGGDVLDSLGGGRAGGTRGAGGVSLGGGWSDGIGKGGGGFDSGGLGLGNRGGLRVADYKSNKPQVLLRSRIETIEGIDRATIRRYMRLHASSYRYCYVSVGLAANPRLRGTIKVTFVISPRGKVLQSSVTFSTLNHAPTESCIANAVRRIRFPKTGGRTAYVTYPLHFRPAGQR